MTKYNNTKVFDKRKNNYAYDGVNTGVDERTDNMNASKEMKSLNTEIIAVPSATPATPTTSAPKVPKQPTTINSCSSETNIDEEAGLDMLQKTMSTRL